MPASLLHQLNNLDVLTSALMGGVAVQLQPISGDVPVLQVSIEGRDELPIFVTCSDTQIICICYLWTDDDVRAALPSWDELLDLAEIVGGRKEVVVEEDDDIRRRGGQEEVALI